MLLSAQGSQAARGIKRKRDEWLRDMPLVDFGGGGGRRGQPQPERYRKRAAKVDLFCVFRRSSRSESEKFLIFGSAAAERERGCDNIICISKSMRRSAASSACRGHYFLGLFLILLISARQPGLMATSPNK